MSNQTPSMSDERPLLLMTGASGFVGNHTLNNFLRHGYHIRTAVRNQNSFDRILQIHSSFENQIEMAIVPDIAVSGAFDEAVTDVVGIIHIASPYTIKVENNERDLIVPALNGTKAVLESAYRYGKNVKRVVITSSFAAIADFSKGLWPGHVYDESQWNPMTYQSTKDDTRGFAYSGSKKLAEEFAWSFMSSHHDVSFTLATINPVMIYGPLYPGSGDIKHLGQSLGPMHNLLTASQSSEVPFTPLPYFVDVRDVAEAHRLAFESRLEHPGRFLLSSGMYNDQAVCDLWRDEFKLEGRIPIGKPMSQVLTDCYQVTSEKARQILGLKFRDFKECFVDMGDALLQLERQQRN